MGLVKIENIVVIQTGYDAIMQQYNGRFGAERILPGAPRSARKRNMSYACDSKAHLVESDRDTFNAATDLRKFQRKFVVNVCRADFVNAGVNLFLGTTCRRQFTIITVARYLTTDITTSNPRRFNENHHKQYAGNTIIGSVGEHCAIVLLGTDEKRHRVWLSQFYSKFLSVACACVSVQSIAIVHFISVDDMLETASEHTKYSGS